MPSNAQTVDFAVLSVAGLAQMAGLEKVHIMKDLSILQETESFFLLVLNKVSSYRRRESLA